MTTHTSQSCFNKPGKPDLRRHRERFGNVPLVKEKSETFAQERQTNNEGVWFRSLTKLFSGTMKCMRSQHETHWPWTQRQVDPNQCRHLPHDWKPRTSGWYHMPRNINLRISWWQREIDDNSNRLKSQPRSQFQFINPWSEHWPRFLRPSVRWPKMLDCLKWNWSSHLRQKEEKAVLAPNS